MKAYKSHKFVLDLTLFKTDYSKLPIIFEPITEYYEFQSVSNFDPNAKNLWDLDLSKCGNVLTKSERSIVGSKSLSGFCMIKTPKYPVKIEICGGDERYKIGIYEITNYLSGYDCYNERIERMGCFFSPTVTNGHYSYIGIDSVKKVNYTKFSPHDIIYTISLEDSKLIVSGSNQSEQVIFENIPVDKKYMLCVSLNSGPLFVRIVSGSKNRI